MTKTYCGKNCELCTQNSIAYALILLKMSCEEVLYRTAAYYYFIGAALSLVAMLSGIDDTASLGLATLGFALLISLGTAVVGLVGEYNEYKAHANVVRDLSEEMAHKWEKLWKYYVKLIIGLVVVLLFASALPLIGMIVAIILVIGILAVSIIKIVYVYETAKLFQSLAERL